MAPTSGPEVPRLRPFPATASFPPRKSLGFFDSLLHAWNGLLHTLVYQMNMRVHVVSAALVGLVGSGIPLGLAEKVTLIFCVLLVFFAEILNTALEHLVDLAVQQFDEKARVAKDAAAAGVLVLAFGTVVIFAAILVHNWDIVVRSQSLIARQVLLGIPLTAIIAWLVLPVRRSQVVDALLFLVGAGIMVALIRATQSYVFSALTASVLVLAGAAARERRRIAK